MRAQRVENSRNEAHRGPTLPASAIVALIGALGALFTGCASSGAVPKPFPAPSAPSAVAGGTGQAVADLALDFRGTPYRSGGADPSGFDCSGLVQYVFARRGLVVPRLVIDQFLAGQPVDRQGIAAGDLVFFRIDGQDVSHVGIAVSGGAFVHAPKARGIVRVESLDAAYWTARYAGARRIGG
jgi:cell wall-associated NlpC family hydrolase